MVVCCPRPAASAGASCRPGGRTPVRSQCQGSQADAVRKAGQQPSRRLAPQRNLFAVYHTYVPPVCTASRRSWQRCGCTGITRPSRNADQMPCCDSGWTSCSCCPTASGCPGSRRLPPLRQPRREAPDLARYADDVRGDRDLKLGKYEVFASAPPSFKAATRPGTYSSRFCRPVLPFRGERCRSKFRTVKARAVGRGRAKPLTCCGRVRPIGQAMRQARRAPCPRRAEVAPRCYGVSGAPFRGHLATCWPTDCGYEAADLTLETSDEWGSSPAAASDSAGPYAYRYAGQAPGHLIAWQKENW